MILYHNPRCSKSRQALNLLNEKVSDLEVKKYLEESMEKSVLIKALELLGESMIRKKEPDYKDFIVGNYNSNNELAELMLKYPKTIERPLLVNGNKMALGRPVENILKVI